MSKLLKHAQDTKMKHTPEQVSKERKALEFSSRLRLVHWAILALSLALTIAVWQYARYQHALRTEVRFDFAANQTTELIKERLQKYELALLSGVAAMRTHDNDMSAETWRQFADNLEIEKRYPGINGIGVIFQVDEKDVPDFLAKQRLQRPDFKIHPKVEGIFDPITYIEPVVSNQEAVGLNMGFETNRHTALIKARDLGQVQISGPIVLVQDETKTPGFLLKAPFYAKTPDNSFASRRAEFIGAVYAPFVVNKLMSGLLDKDNRQTAVRITDGSEVLYDEIHADEADYDADALGQKQIRLNMYGRQWTLDIQTGLDFRADNAGGSAWAILVMGLSLDAALLALFLLLTRANRRALRFGDLASASLKSESLMLKSTVDQLKQARAEAETVSEMKSIFMSTMSHEVRTPLTAISGILVLLERAGLEERPNKLVQTGIKASDKLMKLLTDVLDSSRLEVDAVELWEREVALKPLLEECQTLAEGMIEKLGKDIIVVADVLPDTPDTIFVDDIRLSQILNNLMDNAIRFTESGQIKLSTSGSAAKTGKVATAIISVGDTGIGIAQKDLDVIFDRFRQVDGSLTRERDGTGLGLAISHDLVTLMGGELTVKSQVDTGTVFELRLPIGNKKEDGTKDD